MSAVEPNPSCPTPNRLAALLADRAPERERSALHAHLDGCASCQLTLEVLASDDETRDDTARRLRALRSEADAGPSLHEVVAQLRSLDPGALDADAGAEADDAPGLSFLTPSEAPGSLGRLGEYEVLSVIGRGGMGVVLLALDPSLRRVVALKVLAPHLASRPVARQRFLREARLSAAVVHENVVPVHAVQEAEGVPFLVMQYVEGVSLQQRLDAGATFDVRETLWIGLQAARGLIAAHERGVVHRDIKPGNLLLEGVGSEEWGVGEEEKEGTPPQLPTPHSLLPHLKIVDFGLARVMDETGYTESGVALGTPAFMSPEQAQDRPVDARSDLFSLGSVLYVLCTGRHPFGGDHPLTILRRVCDAEPAPVRALNPRVPAWLARLIERLHAKDPDGRPASAAQVAELLERGLAHLERPDRVPPPAVPAGRRRGPLAALLLAVVAGGLALALGLASYLTDPAGPPSILAEGVPVVCEPLDQLFGHEGPVRDLLVTRDGRYAFSCSGWPEGDHTIRQWDLATGEAVRVFTGHNENINDLALSPDGTRLLSASADATLRLWDTATGEELRRLEGHLGQVRAVDWSPDGRHAISSGNDDSVLLWDVDAGQEIRRFRGASGWVGCLAFAPDGRRFLAGSRDGEVRLWDVETGTVLLRLTPGRGRVNSLNWSPDGRYALIADQIASLWNLETGAEVRRYAGHVHPVNQAVFSPDGRRALTVGYDWRVNLLDLATGEVLARFQHHTEFVWAVAFTPDGRRALSGGGGVHHGQGYQRGTDHAIRVWDLSRLPPAPR